MKRLIAFALLVALAAPVVRARAQDVPAESSKKDCDYAVDYQGNLWEVDCDKLAFRKVGKIKAGDDAPILCDLGATADGYLYGISGTTLYLIKIEKPEESIKVGDHGLANPYGMGIGPDGKLLVNTRGGEVYTLDPKTAKATHVGEMTGGFGASGDIAQVGERFVSSVKDDDGHEVLVTLDAKKGTATKVGRFRDEKGEPVADVFGLICRKDVLYALTQGGDVLVVDVKTAKCTRKKSTGIQWWGATDYQRI